MRIIVLLILCFAIPVAASAQAVNYIDESGNVHFADSLQDVPFRYRSQIVTKKPEITNQKEYQKAQQEYKKKLADIEKQKRIDEKAAARLAKEKSKEEAKKRKILEQQQKKLKRGIAPLATPFPGPAIVPTPEQARM